MDRNVHDIFPLQISGKNDFQGGGMIFREIINP